MSCMLDTNKGTDSVQEHHSIHVTHKQYCFPQAYDIKQHPLQYFCKHSTYQYVPSQYSGKTVHTRYVLWVKSMYCVCTSAYSCFSNSHFISGTIVLAAITSLLPTSSLETGSKPWRLEPFLEVFMALLISSTQSCKAGHRSRSRYVQVHTKYKNSPYCPRTQYILVCTQYVLSMQSKSCKAGLRHRSRYV